MPKELCWILLLFIVRTLADTDSDYLGSIPTLKFHFPWLVTFHRNTPQQKEFFGSGSIITKRWVIGSTDCFIRRSKVSDKPYILNIGNWEVHSGGIWGNPYERWGRSPVAPWQQVRTVDELVMYTGVTKNKRRLVFTADTVPKSEILNAIQTSPFGFFMSIALVRLKTGIADWKWTKTTLPIPLITGKSQELEFLISQQVQQLEEKPFKLTCYVGGWRLLDWRLVEYNVVYVPLERCRSIYCSFDDRACSGWPVNGTHVCFKSLTFTEPCWRDQGSALYCRHRLFNSVFAILTSAPTCGYDGLPGIFTLIHHAVALHTEVAPLEADPYQRVLM